MTVVVGFADVDVAFLAADTRRTNAFAPAVKVHVWSDHTLIGQAGCATFMTQAIDFMFKCRSVSGDGVHAAIDGFDQGRKMFHPAAVAALGATQADGTLLIATSDPSSGGPALWTMPFDPQFAERQVQGQVVGIGDPRAPQAALTDWAAMALQTPDRLPTWGTRVINALVGPTVDWPIDLLVARNSAVAGQRVVVRQRLADATAGYDPAFS